MPAARSIFLLLISLSGAHATEQLAPFSVTASRTSTRGENLPLVSRRFDAPALAATLALDDTLRADPAFGLFRRTGSAAAHPTAQGVSLRGIGPSGASRTLVLLDGVPLNDPFGGWVMWNQIPARALASAEILRGGGSGTWGNAALGGTIALVSAPAARAGHALHAAAGERGTFLGELTTGAAAGRTVFRVDTRAFTTDGYHPLAPGARGSVDVPLASEHASAQVRAQRQVGAVEATLTLRHFRDDRVNGTLGQRNTTRLNFASLALRGPAEAGRAWQFAVYGQDQTFRSTFTAVSPDRSSETPANDQFDVPATAAGAALTIEWLEPEQRTSLGADFRRVRGETREDFLFAAGAFARRRFAGGTQAIGGVFAGHDRQFTPQWHGSLGLRADAWQLADGARREVNLATGGATRREIFPTRARGTWSANAGVVWTPHERWRGRAAVYRAFRLPTLNELYRPFRVGNVSTEANAALRHESLVGAEIGADFRVGDLNVSLTGFGNRLEDAVGNVTLASSPTLVSRERRNLERIDVRGGEARITWSAGARFTLDAAWLWSDAEIARAASQPGLLGKRLAQAPRQVATAGARFEFARGWVLHTQGRWTARQFEDDENTLVLGAAGVLDLRLSGAITDRTTPTLALDNIADAAVPVARAANGLTSYAAPRTARVALDLHW